MFGGWGQYGDWKMRAGENEQALGQQEQENWYRSLPYIMDLIGSLQNSGGYYLGNPAAVAGLF